MGKESCGTSHGVRQWCNTDACGVVCASVTWALILYAQYVVNKIVIFEWMGLSFWGVLNFLAFNGVAGLATISHVRAMVTDPGAVPREATPLPEDEGGGLEEGTGADGQGDGGGNRRVRKYCRRCNGFKPPRAHHCSICRRCIIKMDHHCPWVNNCVGIGNHKLFLLFILYIFLMCTYALLLVVARYAGCLHSGGDEISCGDAAGNLLVIFLVIEAVLFGLFTCCMMLDQHTVVATNTTAIDRLKGEYHGVSHRHDVNEVFGGKDGRFRLDWLLPVPAAFPSSIAPDLLGYRTHEEEEAEARRAGARDEGNDEEEEGILMLDRRRSLQDRAEEGAGQGSSISAGGALSSAGAASAVSRERLRGAEGASRQSPIIRVGVGAAGASGGEETAVEVARPWRPVTTV